VAKARKNAVWIDEEDDLEGDNAGGVGRERDNDEYEPLVSQQMAATGSKARPQRAK
jgi:hypothetical protein